MKNRERKKMEMIKKARKMKIETEIWKIQEQR